ncbi:putative phage protein p13 [uncultured Mediterranean phage uvMED]|nr:putative phage protein p13 [uncultured Mediterranean phage uvMED]
MPVTRTFSRSFSGGEISPEMFGRIDDAKFQQGAATMRNFVAKPQGPAENRPGFSFVREVKNSNQSVRLLSFTFSTVQTMIIEMGNEYFRFHTLGQTLFYSDGAAYNNSTNYSVGDIAKSGGVNYYSRTGAQGQAVSNSTHWYAMPTNPNIYEIPHPYQQAELFDVHYVQSADVMTLVHPNHAPRELRRLSATKWELQTINFASPLASPTGVSVSAYIPSSSSTNTDTYEAHEYVVTAVASNLVDESAQSGSASVQNNIYVTGAKNTISWNAVSGASKYRVYKEQAGIYGFLGETTSTSIIDANIAPNFSRTPPIYENEFQSTNNFPGAVSYFEQRRVFAGTNNEPQTILMTKSGTESNLSFGLPIRDDDRIKFRVAARESNTIRHIVPLTNLLMLTGSAEWRVSSINSDAITPTSISVKPQSYVGANNAQPVIVNNSMVYAASRGGHVRELGYNWQANGFITGDLSLRAPHLFDNLTVTDMALSKAPIPIVWFISSGGKLLGFTYVPEQTIGAWHQHDTDGTFESVAVVSEGNDDVLYCVVKRTINGATKKYVERLGTRLFNDARDCFFVDCGSTYNGTNTNTNQTVTISGGTNYTRGESVTITANYNLFNAPPSLDDVGDAIVLISGSNYYRCNITATTNQTVATVKLDVDLPASLRNTGITTYEVARNVISGLDHLEGKTVSILADAAVHPQRVVSSGSITLERASSVVHVGLEYESDLQSMPMALQTEAFGQGRVKNINHVWLRVLESSGIFAGPSADKLVEAKQRTTEAYGAPPRLKTEDIKIMVTPTWQDNGQLFVRQTDPLPLTVVGMTLEVAIGG